MQQRDYTGKTLDKRYKILKLLASGGMGAVYLGKHIVLDKKIAVKFLHAGFVSDKNVVKRFYREAQTAAAVRHKNIIEVLDVGVSDAGDPYLMMEYLEGESLASMLSRTGPINLPAACAILEPALTALSAAHAEGIVHRDLKPENIFIAEMPGDVSIVKLIDFGISKFTALTQSEMTRTGVMLGTPSYMSPEQIIDSKVVDHRTDLYAIGVILYEMLTGKRPFEGESFGSIVYNVMSKDPIPPKEAYSEFPTEVEPLVMRTLSKSPDNRPQSAVELLEELKTLKDYQDRHQQLSAYTTGIRKKNIPGGDLGPEIHGEDEPVAREVLSSITPKTSTPTSWLENATNIRQRRYRARAFGGMGLLLLVGIAGAVVSRLTDNEGTVTASEASVSVKEAAKKERRAELPLSQRQDTRVVPNEKDADRKTPTQQEQSVELEIKDAPKNAVITFNDKVFGESPLKIKKSDIEGKLKVSAPGYIPQEWSIVPNRDQAITAVLEPMKQRQSDERPVSHVDKASEKQDAQKTPRARTGVRKPVSTSGKKTPKKLGNKPEKNKNNLKGFEKSWE